jgi:AcrR family transcriptional regulator
MEALAHLGAIDPRVRRTRLMLFEALQALLHEKDFEKISVQDIAEKAALNRATFYDHYPDKFALLESMVHERFERLIVKHGLRFDVCEGAIKRIALIVCDFITDIGCDGTTKRRQLEMHVQMAVIATIRQIIVEGSKRYRQAPATVLGDRRLALIATSAAWAICGATNEWARTPDRGSDDEVAEAIETIVAPMFSTLVEPVAQNA